ncbi:chemotaxis methyl-accepting protein methylase/chemotaxis response regulator CheB [Bradyrhizobium sp. USDA 4486]
MSVAFAGNSTTGPSREAGPLRVMIVDDSVVIRGLISRWIGAEHDMEVAASLRTGLEAVNQLERINPDVAVLDIEMPELDGLSALPRLLAKKRDLVIIMASTLTRRNAEISFKALSLGAADYIPKPESTREAQAADIFHHDLIQKIRHLGARLRRKTAIASPPLAPASPAPAARGPIVARPAAPAPTVHAPSSGALSTRPFSTQVPKVLLIGSSTGGPQALMALVTELGSVIDRFPVLITQHMPPTFTTILAEHLARSSRRPAAEAVDGEPVKPGRIYLAPGGKHMRVARSGADVAIALDDGAGRQFLQARGRSVVHLRHRHLARRHSLGDSDGHGLGRHARRQGHRRGRRQRDRAGRSLQRGLGHAGRGCQCGHLRGDPAAQPDRRQGQPPVCGRPLVTPADYDYLRKFLKERSGLDLSADKQYLVESRLLPLARKASLSGIPDLVLKIRNGDGRLATDVVEAMTTNETFFYRDKIPFDHLRETILPGLIQARAARKSLRIWSAASSTGQEPYSIAMCVKEMGAALAGWRIEIIATDLSQEVLEKSKAGVYSQFEVQRGLPIQHLMKYFTQVGELWQLNADIRAMVQFRQLNLLQDFSHLGTFDVIFCRNVLIYFDQDTKAVIFERMAKGLEADGTLLLGAAESVVGITDAFRPITERRGLYQLNPARSGRPMGGLMPQPLKVAAAR